jgi:hypothetical protein
VTQLVYLAAARQDIAAYIEQRSDNREAAEAFIDKIRSIAKRSRDCEHASAVPARNSAFTSAGAPDAAPIAGMARPPGLDTGDVCRSTEELIDELMASLDRPDPAVDALWADEAEDRLAAYDRGEMATHNISEVGAKLHARETAAPQP